MEEITHKAAQYLATAAISFLEKKEDDSHTNLGWYSDSTSLRTHPLLLDGLMLAFNYNTFSLEWILKGNVLDQLKLSGTSHSDIVAWISSTSMQRNITKKYEYRLHYDLPYDTITDDYIFEVTDADRLQWLIKNRTMAQEAIARTLEVHHLDSDIRIWPHHFDTGAFVSVDANRSIGFGMAMPDTMINDFYYYVSGYRGHDFIDPASFETPSMGTVYSEGWKGIAQSVSGLDKETAFAFLNEAITLYKNNN